MVREAYEIVKAQVEAEEGDTEDGLYAAVGRAPNGDMGEGAEQVPSRLAVNGRPCSRLETTEAG